MIATHRNLHQILFFACLFIFLFQFTVAAHDNDATTPSPESALEKLIAGNERFMKGSTQPIVDRPAMPKNPSASHPYAILLTCADAVLSPEAVFDEAVGNLFVVRVAGNVSDPVILGSIEYAAEHLHAPLLVVMGHETCGAIKVAVANQQVPPNIAKIVQRLRPAVEKARVYGRDENEILQAAIKENVRYQVKMMTFESDVLGELVNQHKLQIIGSIYRPQTGQVEFLQEKKNAPAVNATPKSTPKPTMTPPANKTPQPVPAAPHVKALVAPAPAEKKPTPAPTPAPAKKAPAKSDSHHDDEEARLMPAPPVINAEVRRVVPFASLPFAAKLRAAYENNYEVTLKTSALLRDSKDRCLSNDCRSLPAGEVVTLDSPYIQSVMGRPSLRVRHRKQSFYIPAEEKNFAFSEVVAPVPATFVNQVLSVPSKLMNAFSPTSNR